MAKIVVVSESDDLEEILTKLENEGYKSFSFLHGSEIREVVRNELPENHPQRVLRQHFPTTKIVATGKKASKKDAD